MKIQFYKYQGTGNDFILIDNREKKIQLDATQIKKLCDRHFGIGADGLMLLQNEEGFDFRMVYYNADGNESTMCGNGGRCIAAFAKRLGVIEKKTKFVAIDGAHLASIDNDNTVRLQMIDVNGIQDNDTYAVLNTGSPHYVLWVDDVFSTDVFNEGRRIRNQDVFQPKGINVNFAEHSEETVKVRTYERGVEDETLSCGTGVTAVAIASVKNKTGKFVVNIETPGGKLNVSFDKENKNEATNVWLSGTANFVYMGNIDIG